MHDRPPCSHLHAVPMPLPLHPASLPGPLLPSLLLLAMQDEVDALAGQRSSSDDASSRRLLTELLLQMTRAAEQDALYVFACTNRIQAGRTLAAWVRWSAPSLTPALTCVAHPGNPLCSLHPQAHALTPNPTTRLNPLPCRTATALCSAALSAAS